jgi:hypothetical protein
MIGCTLLVWQSLRQLQHAVLLMAAEYRAFAEALALVREVWTTRHWPEE